MKTKCGFAAVLFSAVILAVGSVGFAADEATTKAAGGAVGTPARDAKQDDPIENRYPIAVGKPTVEEITQTLVRLMQHIDEKSPATVVDTSTKAEVTDFSKVNANAKLTLGGYPYGVIHAGMLSAAEATGDKRFAEFTAKRLALVSGDMYAYWKKQADEIGMAKSSVKNIFVPNSLDSCGAWGAALVKARIANVGPDTKPIIDTWADYVHTKQYRLADGTLARKTPEPESLWGDDMYMSIPLLAQMGKMTGNAEYTDDAVKQALQISERLFKPAKGLYAHGWFAANDADQFEAYWGRVNGWCIMATCELLDTLPADHPRREALLLILRTHIKSLAKLQSSTGLWHQLLDKEDSYLETSCTAMFSYSIMHAVNKGWINPSYGAVAQAGWAGVMSRQTKDGGFDGTCIGTNIAYDNTYYYYRPAIDDVHGYGPVLLAGSEMIRALKNPGLSIKFGRGGFYQYSPAAQKTEAPTVAPANK